MQQESATFKQTIEIMDTETALALVVFIGVMGFYLVTKAFLYVAKSSTWSPPKTPTLDIAKEMEDLEEAKKEYDKTVYTYQLFYKESRK
jgi:hypothetical protein